MYLRVKLRGHKTLSIVFVLFTSRLYDSGSRKALSEFSLFGFVDNRWLNLFSGSKKICLRLYEVFIEMRPLR